jgi:hypothetical protein
LWASADQHPQGRSDQKGAHRESEQGSHRACGESEPGDQPLPSLLVPRVSDRVVEILEVFRPCRRAFARPVDVLKL